MLFSLASGTAPPKNVSRVASGTKHSGSSSQKRQDALGRMTQTSKKSIDRVLAAKSASSSSSASEKIPDGPMKNRKRRVAKKEIGFLSTAYICRETCVAKKIDMHQRPIPAQEKEQLAKPPQCRLTGASRPHLAPLVPEVSLLLQIWPLVLSHRLQNDYPSLSLISIPFHAGTTDRRQCYQ